MQSVLLEPVKKTIQYWFWAHLHHTKYCLHVTNGSNYKTLSKYTEQSQLSLPLPPFSPKYSTLWGRTCLNHTQGRIYYDVLNWQGTRILSFFGGKCYYQIAWGTTSLPEKRKIKAALNMTNCAKMFERQRQLTNTIY